MNSLLSLPCYKTLLGAAFRCCLIFLLSGAPLFAAPSEEKLEARLGTHHGWNTIFVNGRPVAPQIYSGTEHSRKTWEGRARQSIEEFSSLGYEIIQSDFWFKYSLRADGTFDMPGIRRQLAGILDANPRAAIVVRVNVSAPKWWLEANPGELCKVTADGPNKNRLNGNSSESLASGPYAEFAQKYLKLFLQELEKTPEGNRVIGFHIGGGVYGEWHYYGIYNEPDASEPMRRSFAAFGLRRYGTLAKMNEAWRTSFPSANQIVVPSFARRYEVADGDFRDPQKDRYVIDYYECQQAVVSELVNGLAKVTKETWPRPTLVGLFYGYLFGGWTVGSQASQFDIWTLFNSPYVDYFSGPYASRNMYGSAIFRSLADSLSLRGKVWISEHDGGSHLLGKAEPRFPDNPRNEAESIARMRKNFMYTITENAGQWWYDFGPGNQSGWWSSPAMLSEAGSLLRLTDTLREKPFFKPADVLVVYDMRAFNAMRPAKVDQLSNRCTQQITNSLLGTGAALDRIFLMDLPKVDLSRYKLVVFTNIFWLTSADRAYVASKVKAAGTSVVFMSGAGYTDGILNDAAFISSLTGLHIEKCQETDSTVSVTLGGKAFPLNARAVITRFKLADPSARAIGTYKSGAPAAAVRDFGKSRIYYFGVPLDGPLDFFKALMEEAGARLYVKGTVEHDYVSIGGGIIGIASVSGGKRTILPIQGPPVEVTLAPFSTQYFDLATGTLLTPGSN